ncbi:tetraspanin-7-like [Ostrea edulis]|uniref:tetraspanin-7-like n=1 Tax=Ostrea edulis TaxID=37623 RepID=UPI0020949CB2|nr:tetraspanin-7-like [Ostrea edulis]
MDRGRAKSTMSTTAAVGCMKTLLMIFNFIFWVTGISILALGIWTKVDLYKYMELSTIYYKDSPWILIAVGALIVIVGSFGCCCTAKGNVVLLYMYGLFLVLVFAVELGAGAAGFFYKGKLEQGFKEGLENALKQYGNGNQAMDELQTQLHCCGSKSYVDWFSTPWEETKNGSRAVPRSCCKTDVCNNMDVKDANVTDINTTGCYTKVVDFMQSNMAVIAGVAFGISFFQLLGALLACCLAKRVNKSKYEQMA